MKTLKWTDMNTRRCRRLSALTCGITFLLVFVFYAEAATNGSPTLVCADPVYDFGASDLPARVRQLGFELAFRRRLLRSPPPETMFLHRKLVGSFLLLARLRAQVDARSLILPFLDGA